MVGSNCGQRKPDAAAQAAHRQNGLDRRGSGDGRGHSALATWPTGRPTPSRTTTTSELAEILRKTIQGLPRGFRVVFALRDVEGLSTEETAEALGLSVPAVKSRLLRARLQLRERLSRYFRGGAKAAPLPTRQAGAPAGKRG